MSFRSTGSPTISRKHSGGDSFSNDGGVEVHNISFGRERSVSEHRKDLDVCNLVLTCIHS